MCIVRICLIHFDASAYKEASWMRSILGEGYSPQKTRKLKADAIPTEYLKLIVNKVPDETAQSICTEEQSNVEYQIVEQYNNSSYSQSYDTNAKEKTLKQNKNIQRMCQKLLARNKYLERELFKQRKRVKVNSDIRIQKILCSIFTPGQIKLLLNPNKKKVIGLQRI
ncbi:uncharacterized protein LOC118648885 [Monomorium pharaonis]|uniref:uncharacterized protein LOC118648885 n=1 Tax=Monomorium pharaonis TaxID=307658 RepID=UPI001746D25A|nr:uncharacterized protein LOC118648885 [Monomorium pharaonis]